MSAVFWCKASNFKSEIMHLLAIVLLQGYKNSNAEVSHSQVHFKPTIARVFGTKKSHLWQRKAHIIKPKFSHNPSFVQKITFVANSSKKNIYQFQKPLWLIQKKNLSSFVWTCFKARLGFAKIFLMQVLFQWSILISVGRSEKQTKCFF